jgi:hypothetical protein
MFRSFVSYVHLDRLAHRYRSLRRPEDLEICDRCAREELRDPRCLLGPVSGRRSTALFQLEAVEFRVEPSNDRWWPARKVRRLVA